MPRSHHFLNWDSAFVPQLVDLLLREFAGDSGNFADVCLVVGGSRAARAVLTQLVQSFEGLCQESKKHFLQDFIPPLIITPSSLPEVIYALDSADYASELERVLAWQAALGDNQSVAAKIFNSQALKRFSLEFAEQLDSFYQEIQRAGHSIDSAAELLSESIDFPDLQRWQAVAQLVPCYHAKLRRLDPGSTELRASEAGAQFRGTLIVAGIVELTPAIRRALTLVEDQLVLVSYAPEALRQHFDRLGCVTPDYWTTATLPLEDSQITIGSSDHILADQVANGAERIAAVADHSAVVIGVCDPQLEHSLARAFDACGTKLHLPTGTSMQSCGLIALCNGVADYIDDESAENLARLVRLPEFEGLLGTQLNTVAALDRARYQTLPLQATDALNVIEHGAEVAAMLKSLVRPSEQSSAILCVTAILQKLLADNDLYDSDQMLSLESLIEDLALCGSSTLRVSDYLRLLARQLARMRVPDAQSARGFEALGWLELLLDEAACVLLAGMHEEAVPGSIVSDAWLPENARKILGIITTQERVARDTYVLSALCARTQILQVYCAQSSHNGETPLPSQLLMRCQRELLPARVLHLASAHAGAQPLGRKQRLIDPPPPPPAPKTLPRLSISGINAYIRDPYSFALNYVERLEFVDDQQAELDSLQFGTLVHEVIARFSAHLLASDVVERDFEQLLQAILDQEVIKRFAQPALVSVAFQIDFIAQRLKRFAQWQREQLAEGWQVFMVEHSIAAGELTLTSAFGSTQLTGRIDRIDYNPRQDIYLILDFKTGSSGKARTLKPKDGRWEDLQLPLYSAWFTRKFPNRRALASYLEIDKSDSALSTEQQEFDQDAQAAALDQATSVVAAICRGQFAASLIPSVKDRLGLLFPPDIDELDDQMRAFDA